MSSCLTGGGRTYGFDLDIVRSQSPSARSSHSSSPSSTLSESSNSPRGISTKRARTPRKRPNQTYTEAATLLSTVYPKVFSPKNLGKLCKHTRPYESFSESPELLPPFPVIGDAGFLIRNQSPEKPSFRFDPKPPNSIGKVDDFLQPGSPSPLEDFDAESILDEEVKEGIDSIMGNLSMNNSVESANCNPFFGSFGLRGRFELGFGFGNIRRALRHVDDGEWWRSPTVAVNDIVPKFKALPSPSSSEKKKKKKVEKEEVKQLPTSTPAVSQENLKSSLLLKLNCDEVIHEWSDRGFPFGNVLGTSESSAEAITRLVDIDLFPEASSGGMREASVMRYKEKRRNRLFSKKIRYQVRKVNADRRPRMKASGRFVKRPALLEEAIDEEMKEES